MNCQVRKLKLMADNQSVYRFKLFYNGGKVALRYECKKRKGDLIEKLEHAVYLTDGLWQALEKRVSELVSDDEKPIEEGELTLAFNEKNVPKNKPVDYETIKRLIAEYSKTSCALLEFILSSRHLFPRSRVVYFDPNMKQLVHSGFIMDACELE